MKRIKSRKLVYDFPEIRKIAKAGTSPNVANLVVKSLSMTKMNSQKLSWKMGLPIIWKKMAVIICS